MTSDVGETPSVGVADLRCSVQSFGTGEASAGTAPQVDQFLLAELPLPWPSRIEDHPMLNGVAAQPQGLGTTRVLAVRSNAEAGPIRLIRYSRASGAFDGFERSECFVDPMGVAESVGEVIANPTSSCGFESDSSDIVDVLVCTHGARDRCCGQLGTVVYLDLLDRVPDNVRLWRSSHIGGHRFAPTAITLPNGFAWSTIDANLLIAILAQSAPPADLVGSVRGCSAFGAGPAQVADIAALQHFGWAWLEHPRSIVVAGGDGHKSGSPSADQIEVRAVSAKLGCSVLVTPQEPSTIPVCGQPLESAVKSAPQWSATVLN